MRTIKELLRKADHLRGNALTAPAAYRLYVFVPWADIPDEIKPHFREDAKVSWDIETSTEDLDKDIELQIITIINELAKGKTVQALMFIPMLFADLYVMGNNTGSLEGVYTKMVNKYSTDLTFDRIIADMDLMETIYEILKDVIRLGKVELAFSLEEEFGKLIADLEQQVMDTPAHESQEVDMGKLHTSIDDAIKTYNEQTGEDLIASIDTGEDLLKDIIGNDGEEKLEPVQ